MSLPLVSVVSAQGEALWPRIYVYDLPPEVSSWHLAADGGFNLDFMRYDSMYWLAAMTRTRHRTARAPPLRARGAAAASEPPGGRDAAGPEHASLVSVCPRGRRRTPRRRTSSSSQSSGGRTCAPGPYPPTSLAVGVTPRLHPQTNAAAPRPSHPPILRPCPCPPGPRTPRWTGSRPSATSASVTPILTPLSPMITPPTSSRRSPTTSGSSAVRPPHPPLRASWRRAAS